MATTIEELMAHQGPSRIDGYESKGPEVRAALERVRQRLAERLKGIEAEMSKLNVERDALNYALKQVQ